MAVEVDEGAGTAADVELATADDVAEGRALVALAIADETLVRMEEALLATAAAVLVAFSS